MAPIIGISLAFEGTAPQVGSKPECFASFPYYALRKNYFDAVTAAGGLPIGIPHRVENIDDYLNVISGCLIPGGDVSFDPKWYPPDDESVFTDSPRFAFDSQFVPKALARGMPFLGICMGMQVMAGLHGARLSSDIRRHVRESHGQVEPLQHRDRTARHGVEVAEGSLLHRLAGSSFTVNTYHREGVTDPGSSGLTVTAKAPDGVIEAIELPQHRFALGVQWHPEYLDHAPENLKILRGFVDAAREYQVSHNTPHAAPRVI